MPEPSTEPPDGRPGLRRLSPGDRGYPPGIASLSSPPDPLWLAGLEPPAAAVAVVGTRHPDGEGRRLAAAIGGGLARRGVAVVSGLAAGIDTAAHRAALSAGGSTWAVVGCGADAASVPEDPDLAADMVTSGGILSEVEPGTPATPRALVARDRLQTAMSLAAVVVQSDLASGTMHTARFALLQGRPLAVVAPGGRGRCWAGNVALCDPEGCPPEALHARGATARTLAGRRPAADLILDGDELGPLLELIGWE